MRRPKKFTETFDQWVSRNGGELLTATNEFELHRWKAWGKSHVVYRGKRSKYSFSSDEARKQFTAWQAGESMRLNDRVNGYLNGEPVIRALVARDGNRCFFCNEEFSEERKPTIEHLVSRVHKGPDHISNKFLAHKPCNEEAGHLSAVEKIRLRESKVWQ